VSPGGQLVLSPDNTITSADLSLRKDGVNA
jgi:hypothetical protein